MRIGILANSLPAARQIYSEVADVPDSEVYVLLCPVGDEASSRNLMRHVARAVVKPGRMDSLRAIASGRIVHLSKPLHDPETVARLKEMQLDVGLHKSGNIYRRETIDCFRVGILNAHIGLLPKYRGRSVMEWSLVQGDPVGVSVFFLDEGIDTGERIVFSEIVDVSHFKNLAEAKQYLFDLDAKFYRRAIERLQTENVAGDRNDDSGRRYYVMSKLFQGVGEECLASGERKSEF